MPRVTKILSGMESLDVTGPAPPRKVQAERPLWTLSSQNKHRVEGAGSYCRNTGPFCSRESSALVLGTSHRRPCLCWTVSRDVVGVGECDLQAPSKIQPGNLRLGSWRGTSV